MASRTGCRSTSGCSSAMAAAPPELSRPSSRCSVPMYPAPEASASCWARVRASLAGSVKRSNGYMPVPPGCDASVRASRRVRSWARAAVNDSPVLCMRRRTSFLKSRSRGTAVTSSTAIRSPSDSSRSTTLRPRARQFSNLCLVTGPAGAGRRGWARTSALGAVYSHRAEAVRELPGSGRRGGGSRRCAQCARAVPGLMAEHTVELRVTAEPGGEGGGQRGGVVAVAVCQQKAVQPLLVAVAAERDACLGLEQSAEMRGAHSHGACQARQSACAGIGPQQVDHRADRWVDVDAVDDLVTVEERPPGPGQQVGQPGVCQRAVPRLGGVDLAEESLQTAGVADAQAA